MQNVSKRTILWIVPILIIAIFWYFYGPQEEITDNEYITYIKESTVNGPNTTLENAFASSCADEKWVYFKTQKNHNVVEFKGSCTIDSNETDVNLQFVVKDEQQGYQVGALLLNGEQQSENDRDEILSMIAAN